MDAYDPVHIRVLSGLEPIRLRPGMYIGVDEAGRCRPAQLLMLVVDGVACELPLPQEIRVLLWRQRVITVAYDGAPLPIEPFCHAAGGVSEPALHDLFMRLSAGSSPCGRIYFGSILNALSERLVVSTMHDGRRCRAVFSKGAIVSPLGCEPCDRPLGTTWLTFRPDPTIFEGGPLTASDAESITERVRQGAGVPARVEDRTAEHAAFD